MPVNTPYIGMPSRETTDFTSAVSVGGDSDFSGDINQRNTGSAVTFASNDVDFSGTGVQISNAASVMSIAGDSDFSGDINQRIAASTVTFAGEIVSTGTLNMFASPPLGGVFLSRHTTVSATSLVLADGEFAIMFESVTSARLVFRSGVTTYTWIATTGGLL